MQIALVKNWIEFLEPLLNFILAYRLVLKTICLHEIITLCQY